MRLIVGYSTTVISSVPRVHRDGFEEAAALQPLQRRVHLPRAYGLAARDARSAQDRRIADALIAFDPDSVELVGLSGDGKRAQHQRDRNA